MATYPGIYMKAPKVYLETTLFNFYFAQTRGQYYGRTVEYCTDARRFFEAVRAGEFEPYTSKYVTDEIEDCDNEEHRLEMGKLIADHDVIILSADERAERLADLYVEATAIPARYRDDALHIAIATVNGLDSIVSLNFEHIVKNKAIRMTAMINEAEGYKGIDIRSLGEVTGYGKD